MSDEHEVTAGMDRMIGELLEHADRDRLPDTMLYFESYDGRNHVAVSAARIPRRGMRDSGRGARGSGHSGLAGWALSQRRARVA